MGALMEKREAAIDELRQIKAAAGQKGFTVEQSNRIEELGEQVKSLDEQLKAAERGERLLEEIGGGAPSSGGAFAKRGIEARRKAAKLITDKLRSKQLIVGGSHPIPEQFQGSPVLLPSQSSWDVSQLFQVETVTKTVYQYLRQTVREQNAAVVAPGAVKPTSEFSFETVKGELAVVAHLSDPIHTYWMTDFPEAVTATVEQLVQGVFDAEERYLIAGTGTDEPLGLLNAPGALTQALEADALTTTRAAITQLELQGLAANGFILHPADWEALELSRDASGRLEFATGPVDRAEKRLWGVRVATSTHVAQGTGLLVDATAAHIIAEASTRVEAGATGDDFQRNQLRLRAEHRFDVALTRPTGIVKIDLV